MDSFALRITLLTARLSSDTLDEHAGLCMYVLDSLTVSMNSMCTRVVWWVCVPVCVFVRASLGTCKASLKLSMQYPICTAAA